MTSDHHSSDRGKSETGARRQVESRYPEVHICVVVSGLAHGLILRKANGRDMLVRFLVRGEPFAMTANDEHTSVSRDRLASGRRDQRLDGMLLLCRRRTCMEASSRLP